MSSPATRTASWRPRWTRAQVGIALLLALLLVVAGKLFWVQGLDPTGRAEAAAQSRTQTEVIPAVRGDIRDTNGKVLARTLQRYDITVDQTAVAEFTRVKDDQSTEQVTPTQAVYDIADALGLPDTEVKNALDGDKTFNYVARGVTPEQYGKIQDLNLPYVFGQPTFQRSYPNDIPMSPRGVRQIVAGLDAFRYDRLYDNFAGRLGADTARIVHFSADRYIAWVTGQHDDLI